MFTRDDYATLTASQKTNRVGRRLVRNTILIIATVAAVHVACDKIEAKLDSEN